METATERKITIVDVDKITPAPFNPPKRTTTQNLKELRDSIEEIGIVYPLLITENYELIDGHRRLACAKSLNYKSVPTLVAKGDGRRLFDDVNRTSNKLSKKDDLYIYLSGGPISKKAKQTIEKLSQFLDKADLEHAAEYRMSASGILFSMELVQRYIIQSGKKLSPTFQKKLAKYILYAEQSFALRRAMANKIDAGLLMTAIESNTPVG